jgi:hypothetical protein
MTPRRRSRLGLVLAGAAFQCATLAACRQAPVCHFCQMLVPEETRTVVEVDGARRLACDPRCVLTHERQTGRQVRFVESTDFDTRRPLDPAHAWYVSGSDIAPDASAMRMRPSPETTADLHWHRCLPSVLAFATREAAERFQRAHGGRVETLARLREHDAAGTHRPAR